MDQSTLSLISAITGVFAAIAAFISAGIAKSAAKHVRQVERRQLVRDVIIAAQNVITEAMSVDELAKGLKQTYNDLFIFAGDPQSKRKELLIREIEVYRGGIDPLQSEAMKTVETQKSLRELSEEELAQLQTKYDGYLIQVKQRKEKFVHQLETAQKEIQPYREKTIKGE